MTTYLTVSEGSSKKFWSIKVDGTRTFVGYGKIGSSGQQQEKDHGSAEKAKQFADKMIKEKIKKGYQKSSAAEASKTAGKKRQARRGDDSGDDESGSGGEKEEEGSEEDDGSHEDEEPKPKRTAKEIAAAEKLEAAVRQRLAPHRSALLRALQALAESASFKKAEKLLLEIQPDGLQHPGLPVQPFLEDEDGNELSDSVDLLHDIPTILPHEELVKLYPPEAEEECTNGEGSMEIQSKALAVWVADCYRELKLHTRKPHAVIALHDDDMDNSHYIARHCTHMLSLLRVATANAERDPKIFKVMFDFADRNAGIRVPPRVQHECATVA